MCRRARPKIVCREYEIASLEHSSSESSYLLISLTLNLFADISMIVGLVRRRCRDTISENSASP